MLKFPKSAITEKALRERIRTSASAALNRSMPSIDIDNPNWNRTDNIGVQAHFDLLALEPGEQRDTYVATIRVSGNGYNGTGPMVFTVRDGLIASLRIG